MWQLTHYLRAAFKKKVESDNKFEEAIKAIVGRKPRNIKLYRLAVQHSSVAKPNDKGVKESNERLEYLGDAVLGAVVAEYLFKKYPYKNEGFLTEIRSRLVNRESLNMLGNKIGINDIIEFDESNKSAFSHKSIYGDTLEAIVGAVYLDRRYKYCKRFIEKRLLIHYDLEEIIRTNTNYKSIIIEWTQKHGKQIRFDIVDVKGNKQFKEFTAELFIDDESMGVGYGFSKKKAEQNAAMIACDSLNIA